VSLSWYIVHAYSNFEHRVKSGLEERIERMGLQDKFGEILIPTEELDRVKEGVDKPRPKVLFEPGEVVRVIDGPFNDFSGVVETVNYEKSRLQVAVQILDSNKQSTRSLNKAFELERKLRWLRK